jgi:cation:H+ antiporter
LIENHLLELLLWLGELVVASFLLSYGAEHMSLRYSARFIGRTFMSVATTLPEIAIVIYAAGSGFYGTALGAGLGSNLLMMTLGLALMLLIATTRLSKAPLKGVDVSMFRLDKIFLIVTSIASAALFLDGYNYIDGFIFTGLYLAYLSLAFREMRIERRRNLKANTLGSSAQHASASIPNTRNGVSDYEVSLLKAISVFAIGTVGIFFGAQPFIESLQGLAVDSGVSVVVLAVIVSPIAGEMPEKVSMMILARKGASGASIAVANVLGSKIMNNTLLLAVAVFGVMNHGGFFASIVPTPIITYQFVLVTSVTIVALIPMLRKEIGLKVGIMLLALYIGSMLLQLLLPHDAGTH